jgi:Arc/MetJ-type ribon-helix-helix transcriptional regulator
MQASFMSEKAHIAISKELYEKCKRFIEEQGGFSSVEEFVEFVLSEVLSKEETEGAQLSEEEEEKVKERLKALGYI